MISSSRGNFALSTMLWFCSYAIMVYALTISGQELLVDKTHSFQWHKNPPLDVAKKGCFKFMWSCISSFLCNSHWICHVKFPVMLMTQLLLINIMQLHIKIINNNKFIFFISASITSDCRFILLEYGSH